MDKLNRVDLALVNGKILTINKNNEIFEAVAIKDDKIIAVGKTSEILALVENEDRDLERLPLSRNTKHPKIIDLQEKIVCPGFIESHCHPSMVGCMLLYEADMRDITTVDQIIEKLRQKAMHRPDGKWIKGFGYDDLKLEEKRHANRWDLDKATQNHPVFLARRDGHLAVVNSEALRLANVTKDTPDPVGGKIDRDPQTGEPTGVLREQAQSIVQKIIKSYSIKEIKEGIIAACENLVSWGVTSVHDAYVMHDEFVAYQELLNESRLPIRVGMMIGGVEVFGFKGYLNELKAVGIKAGFGNKRLNILGTKFICDGSLSSWTAALYEPYSNKKNERGIIILNAEELARCIVIAHKAGLRPMVHAIGDKAIDIVLDAIEKALNERPEDDHRITIEHCVLPTWQAIDRIYRLGIIPSSSAGYIYELGPTHLLGLGSERIKHYLPHKTYLEKGIIFTGNSDWFVTSADILKQLYSIVTRKGHSGDKIGENQAISIQDALRVYTINGAYSSFEEEIKGSIESGKLADMVVLDSDILTIPEDKIIDIKVELTIVGGKIVYFR